MSSRVDAAFYRRSFPRVLTRSGSTRDPEHYVGTTSGLTVSRSRSVAATVAAIAVLVGPGCSCGDTRQRPLDASMREDIRTPPPPIDGGDETDDAGLEDVRDASLWDTTDMQVEIRDAAGDGGDASPDAAVDAGSDSGPDSGPDAGCAEGLTGCLDGRSGMLVCVNLRRNPCHCGYCNRECDLCGNGSCEADCSMAPDFCRRGEWCTDLYEYACTNRDNDPQHCGECWNACAVDEGCVVGVCTPFLPRDAGAAD